MTSVKLFSLIFAALLLIAPAMALESSDSGEAGSMEVFLVGSEVVIHPDVDITGIGYNVNEQPNLTRIIVAPGEVVVIELNNVPEGNALKTVAVLGDIRDENLTNPVGIQVPAGREAVSIHVYLSLAEPLPKPPQSNSQGGSVIINPAALQPLGVYTVYVENVGVALFPADLVIFQVIMPESYTGDVVLTTYKTPLSLGETNLYHQCDITIEGQLADGETALVRFKILLSVLQARGLTAADACLYHSGNGGKTWDKCPTVYEVRGDMVYYEATVDGFSLFMIVFEKGAATPAGSPDLPPADVSTPGFGAVLVLGALGACAVLRRR